MGASRYVYNWGLAESQRAYELTGKRPRLSDLKKELVRLKKTEAPWLYEVSAHIGQQALVDLDRAFDRFFKGLKGGGPCSGFPRFHKKGERDSARVYEVALEERHLRLPMVGRVRLKETRTDRGFEGRILSATIRRRADRWFVSLTVEVEKAIPVPRPVKGARDVVGVDLGLHAAAVIHDGETTRVVAPQRALRSNLKRMRRLNRQLARKQRGSANRAKAKLELARLHYRISCQRQDFLHQLSSELTKTKSLVVLEDLHLKGMQRNRSLALSVGDAGMGELRRQMAYKAVWYGSTVVVAERFFPSTQLCSGCGCSNAAVRGFEGLKERTHHCTACGVVLDRDENAAINLRRYGLKAVSGGLPEGLGEVTPVERKALAPAAHDDAKPASLKQEATAQGNRRATRRSAAQAALAAAQPFGSSKRKAVPPLRRASGASLQRPCRP